LKSEVTTDKKELKQKVKAETITKTTPNVSPVVELPVTKPKPIRFIYKHKEGNKYIRIPIYQETSTS